MSIQFKQFPKTRPSLPAEYSAIYEHEYLGNRTAGGVSNKIARALESWMHKKVAVSASEPNEAILELGAGSLNHIHWEKNYGAYDVVEPFQKLLETSSSLGLIRNRYSRLSEVPEAQRYNRVISVAVLEHLLDLPAEIAYAGLHLSENGRFCAGVPNEGGWLWRVAWKYGTGLAFNRRTGLDYAILMHYEHVNTVDEIEQCLRYFFGAVSRERFLLPSKSLSLYTFFNASRPNLERCKAFIENT